MKKQRILILLLVTGWMVTRNPVVSAQTITEAEYFINTEPGHGLGTSIPVTPGDTVEFDFSIDLTGVNAGFNYVFTRFKNDLGIWSTAECRPIYVHPTLGQTLINEVVACEYFIDQDPGHGNGIEIPPTPGSEVELTATLSIGSLTPGIHYVFIRYRADNGLWSLADQRPIYVLPIPPSDLAIIEGEFFVDLEPGIGNGTPFSIAVPSESIDENLSLVLPELSLGSHILYIRLKNEYGGWSLIEPRVINICETYGPVSQFTLSEDDNMVLLENQSSNADSIHWHFGDGVVSSFSNVVHSYDEAGMYNLSLIAYNNCGIDTLTQTITIEGLESVSPNTVSNVAISTIHVQGFGFVPGTTMTLMREGFENIVPLSLFIADPTHLQAMVNFSGQATGFWDVSVDIPGAGIFTLPAALEITSTAISNTNILMTSVQPGAVRTGRRAPAHTHIINQNNADIISVPVFYRDISDAQQTTTMAPVMLTGVGFFAESYQYMLDNGISNTAFDAGCYGEALNSVFTGYILPRIHAQSAYDLPFYVKRTVSGTHQRGTGMLYPALGSASTEESPVYQNDVCMSALLRRACEEGFEILINENEWEGCYQQWNDSLQKAIVQIASDSELSQQPVVFDACISALLLHMGEDGCVTNLPATPDVVAIKKVVAHVISNLLYMNDVDGLAEDCPAMQGVAIEGQHIGNDDGNRENEFCDLVQECGGMCISGGAAVGWCLLFGNGVDPNVKTGIGNNVDDIYVDPGDLSPYTIMFENDSAATAPVEIISISDTLEAGKFLLNSFSWGPVALGDSIFFQPDAHDHHQLLLHDLRPFLPYYLLTQLDFDTISGVVSWQFTTLDTLNQQPLDLMLDGFLPPNINDTEGTGDVNFFIQFHPELETGDIIHNHAHIVFDFNQPIITPDWINVIDNTPPESAVNNLPVETELTSFEVSWNGEDNPAGISSYTIYVSQNDGPFVPWIISSSSTSEVFEGEVGSVYKFYSVARDRAGDLEAAPENPLENYDAITEIVTGVTELTNGSALHLFPVPAEDAVYATADHLTGEGTLSLSDLCGNQLMTFEISQMTRIGNALEIDTRRLASGTYLVAVQTGNTRYTGKLVVAK